MPRPQRCRRICAEPEYLTFGPDDGGHSGETVMTMDEYEVIRIVDHDGRTHEQCSVQMDISRTTVTEIYESARRKLAEALIDGKRLRIEGGNYRMCNGSSDACPYRRCTARTENAPIAKKGDKTMRIAVTYENGNIFQHFGRTEQFKIYDIEDGKVVSAQVIGNGGTGHGALAALLAQNAVDALICGGIGGGAQMALMHAGVKLYGGCSGSCDAAVEALIAGGLAYDPAVRCDHHGHEHGEGHACGSHGCGSHNCGNH